MTVPEGYEIEEQTEDKLVIVRRFGSNGNGLIRITGNPHPDPEERKKYINKIIEPLYRVWLENQAKQEEAAS